MSTFRKDRVRLLVLLKKKEGLSRDEFSRQWRAYGEVFSSLSIVKSNVLKYDQVHTTEEYLQLPQQMGLIAPDWDGVVVLDSPNYEKLSEVFLSDDYQAVGISKEEKFIDRPRCQILPVDLASFVE